MGCHSFQQAVFVRMFRRWSAAREAGIDRRRAMAEVYRGPGVPMMAAVAADSLFELVEAQLGRRLAAECCCSPSLGPDETALLGLLRYAADADAATSPAAMPHGLAGAVRWAAHAVRRELGLPTADPPGTGNEAGQPARCPFRPGRGGGDASSGSIHDRRASKPVEVISGQ